MRNTAKLFRRSLILATESDRWNAGPSVAMAHEVLKRIAHAELKILENAGGHFLIEAPERFMQSSETFIRYNTKET